jgi:2-keto-3-deoxy-L-rhamnonate aldolase RhmA
MMAVDRVSVRSAVKGPIVLALALGLAACAGADGGDAGAEPDEPVEEATSVSPSEGGNRVIELLEAGHFIFYSLESGPWDIPTMERFMASMAEASGPGGAHPVTLRIPPVREDREAARSHLAEGLAAGVHGLVLPHVESPGDVALAAEVVGARLWPVNADGDVLTVILIEDQAGIAIAREIVSAPGVGVAIPGPGDLRRAYEGDMEAVENAIQTVLAACKEFDVPCGITAGPDDIAMRLEQGFRMIIVTRPEALAVGLAASGRPG